MPTDNADPADNATTEQPVAPAVNTAEPALLALGYAYNSFCNAELGFYTQLVQMFDSGRTTRELAAGCGVLPKQITKLLETYGPGIRDLTGTETPVKCKNSYQKALHITSIGGMTLLGATVICPECSQPVQLVPSEGDSWVFKSHNDRKKEGS